MTKKAIAERRQTVLNFGLEYNAEKKQYQYLDSTIIVSDTEIETITPDVWIIAMNDIADAISRLAKMPQSLGEIAEFNEVIELKTGIEAIEVHKANKAIIESWKKKCEVLRLNSLEDKETYKHIASARAFLRKIRTNGEKARKQMVEESVAYQKKVNGTWKEYESAIEEIEANEQAKLDKWEEWKNAAALAKKEADEKFLKDRVVSLIGAGIKFNGEYYAIGDSITLTIDAIKNYSETAFSGLLEAIKKEKAKIDEAAEIEAKAEQKRKDDEEKAREELAEAQRKLKEAQEALAEEVRKFNEENEALRKERNQSRYAKLEAIGIHYIPALDTFNRVTEYCNIHIIRELVEEWDNETFTNNLEQYKAHVISTDAKEQQAKKELADKKEKEDKEAADKAAADLKEKQDRDYNAHLEFSEKSYDLVNLGMALIEGYFIRKSEYGQCVKISLLEINSVDMDMWPAKLLTITDAITSLNEATEARRKEIQAAKQAALPEIDKVTATVGALEEFWKHLPKNDIKTAPINKIYEGFCSKIDQLLFDTNSQLNELALKIKKI